ncbi:MAG TPA: iron-containing redox enzyme family protein [Actinomycetota bacterium]|nr:iron-containing redox enzyme family protein [Actinomycetota bacterium]
MNSTLMPEAVVKPPAQRRAATEPELPAARGPLSACLVNALIGSPEPTSLATGIEVPGDPLSDDDFQLALYLCYELHYRSFAGVDEAWEWDPHLIAFRNSLEHIFETALMDAYLDGDSTTSVVETVKAIASSTEGPSLSHYLRDYATLEQFREFVIHRSAYQLKEADPHSWIIPRLDGKAKAALIEIQIDEYGGGRPERMHSELFRQTMLKLGLDGRYGAYLDGIPGVTLATVNLISLFGLHRRLRGAAVGHLAVFEMTSSAPNRRYGDGLRRLGASPEATEFYDEHVEADSVHEVIAAHDLAGGLAAQEPETAPLIRFGARACAGLDSRFSMHVLECWSREESSLRR